MKSEIRILTATDAEQSVALRKRMLLDSPPAFAASPEDDSGSQLHIVKERLASGPENIQIGAFAPDLIGSVGMFRESKLKTRHQLYIWGMYVAPDFREQGIGAALIKAAIEHGRSLDGIVQVHLAVSEDAKAAHSLYESLGFRRWGTEPRAVCVNGEFFDEHHMVFDL